MSCPRKERAFWKVDRSAMIFNPWTKLIIVQLSRSFQGKYSLAVNVYECGARMSSQSREIREISRFESLERVAIAVPSPSLNVVRGGFCHSFRLPQDIPPSPPSSILSRSNVAEPDLIKLCADVEDLALDTVRNWGWMEDQAMTATALQSFLHQCRAISCLDTAEMVVLAVLIGSAITIEAFSADRPGLDFFGPLTGPGPRAIDQMRRLALHAPPQCPQSIIHGAAFSLLERNVGSYQAMDGLAFAFALSMPTSARHSTRILRRSGPSSGRIYVRYRHRHS